MAPLLYPSERKHDFVLTISDNDSISPASGEAEDSSLTPTRSKAVEPGKKRKRRGRGISDVTRGSSKKSKNGLGSLISTTAKINGVHNDELDSTGEDGSAIDSDFEFQISDQKNAVTEDFDGWGFTTEEKRIENVVNRTGVDIDELIARRRKIRPSESNDNPHSFGLGGSAKEPRNGLSFEADQTNLAIVEDEDEKGKEMEGKAEDYEDGELLAPDVFGMGVVGEDDPEIYSADFENKNGISDDSDSPADESVASPVGHPDDEGRAVLSSDSEGDPLGKIRREEFFAPEEITTNSTAAKKSSTSFQSMSLSRPILRGLASVGFSEPTPIQAETIPVALLGKDVVGGAVTGSGKTGAFMIPILERLLYRPRKIPTSRVGILMPTRELAVQCFNVAQKLASFTDVTFCQLVGGFSLREQESVLRSRPDVIIATPGRFIDHMRNSPGFSVDTLEILVLDEADRMLEDGFADELNEILTTIPRSRQTMLFSATMTSNIDKLIRVGLNRPVRIMVDARKQTVITLVQEFVRIRPGREEKRLGYLMHLCTKVYSDRVIIFFRQKKEAHRVRIIFGLCNLKAAELHGSMSQEQRISSIESFRSGAVSFLLATDVASRGLDIKRVETVINYEAPQSHEIYLHRVGRTARAGRSGRSCTIAAEPDRKVVKAAVKSGKAQGAKIVSRVIEPALADAWTERLTALEEDLETIMKEEKEEKQLSQAEMQVRRGENIIVHEGEIMSRAKRTWFTSEKDKRAAKKSGRTELNGHENVTKKTKGVPKLSGKDKKRLDDARERKEGKVWKKGKEEAVSGRKKGLPRNGKAVRGRLIGSKGGRR